MTDVEWTTCTDLQTMLDMVDGRVTERKMRLFACAYCRIVWKRITDRHIKGLVRLSDQSAETPANEQELRACWQVEFARGFVCGGRAERTAAAAYISIIRRATAPDAISATQRERACRLFRCVVGPCLFRPVTIHPAWSTSTVTQLAEAIYQQKAFDRLPILADGLEDAGCDNPDILVHCRESGPHTRGCWPVDLVLGRR